MATATPKWRRRGLLYEDTAETAWRSCCLGLTGCGSGTSVDNIALSYYWEIEDCAEKLLLIATLESISRNLDTLLRHPAISSVPRPKRPLRMYNLKMQHTHTGGVLTFSKPCIFPIYM